MAPPQWAFQPDNFVNRPDEELVCSICRAVFCDPVMTMCSHVFCKGCIVKWLSNSRNCPICRKRTPRFNPPQALPIVKNIILKLSVYCHNKGFGCTNQMSVEGCESHMKECSFELVHCKNKPCKEQTFRKDIEEHESKGCLHRYIKCAKCGSKMSLKNASHLHDCTRALLFRLRKRKNLIRKKNEKIKALREELRNLKEAPSHSSIDLGAQSNASSEFQDDISTVEVGESPSDSDSSDSYIATFEGVEYYESDSDQSSVYESFFRSVANDQPVEFHSAVSYILNEMSAEDQNNAENGNNSPLENGNNNESSNSESLERSPVRRAAKRRHPPALYTSSEDENDAGEPPSISSPKRLPSLRSVKDPQPGNSAGDSSVLFTEAGPSHAEAAAEGSSDSPSNAELQAGSQVSQRTKTLRQKLLAKMRKSKKKSKSPQNSAVFQRTLSLLEQYNLESDPEWKPAYASHRGDTTTESDTDYDFDLEENSNSSSADSDLQRSAAKSDFF